MELILYGAGKMGRHIEKKLYSQGIVIKGYCDSYKKGYVECEDGRKYPIFTVSEISQGDYTVIVTVVNRSDRIEIMNRLIQNQISVKPVEEFIGNTVEEIRDFVAEYHIDSMDDYFESAESESNLLRYWDRDSSFYEMFCKLDTANIVELACGRGRHVSQYIDMAEHITLVDILEQNIEYCKERFRGNEKIAYYKNNGYDLQELKTGCYTSLFTYDAMVHFEMLDIFSYLKETKRILKPGGKALFHHSNNTEDYRITFATATYGRNYMSSELFAYLANRAGLTVVEQRLINWGEINNLDCITLVENAGSSLHK